MSRTLGSSDFDADTFLARYSKGEISAPPPDSHDFQSSIKQCFGLPPADSYVYHAVASVTLGQVQHSINAGARNELHGWYRSPPDLVAAKKDAPPRGDVDAYVAIFASATSTDKALVAFASNAKKGSIRAFVAAYLASKRSLPEHVTVPKKKVHVNPYFDFWAWSCRELEWAGPDQDTVHTRQSHHLLPVLYHHFGCLCPSFESLYLVSMLSRGREIADVGSGNGYWTFMMRQFGLSVHAIDNGYSNWRTLWVGDTIREDGAKWLKRAKDHDKLVLLLVYPQVSTSFTTETLRAYKGSTIIVAGTQNLNGFTAFGTETIDTWMAREMSTYKKTVQVALPSFAAKDEALFVFERS